MNSRKFPTFSQWKQFFKVLGKTERIFFISFAVLFCLSAIYLATNFYIKHTEVSPSYGGSYTEGVVGQPRFINPIYGETNDVDRTLIGLVYSGLMTYDKDGNIINDLVENYQVSDDGKVYTFKLKNNIVWQDGVELTANDVIYTIKTIQNSDYKSPLRANWLDVNAEKISDDSFTISLSAPYNSFLENCTIKIIPQHIWRNVLPENFTLSPYNLRPIGSGPYTLSDIKENNEGFIKNLTLTANKKYYGKVPYISKLYFSFFNNNNDLISAVNQKSVDGFSVSALDEDKNSIEKQVRNKTFNAYSFSIPRYFAIFFNTQTSKILSDLGVRQALEYSVDKQELIQKLSDASKEKILGVDSPILPEYFGYSDPTVNYDFNIDTAKGLLDKAGYKDSDNGTRTKASSKTPAFQFKSYLKKGSSGNEVTQLQGCLSRLDDTFKNLLQSETNGKFGDGTGSALTAFQEKYLPDANSTGETGPGTRTKLNELCAPVQNNSTPLQFTLTTINQTQLVMTANLLKDYWKSVGIDIQIKAVELSELKDIIKNRDYDALLYGQALGSLPDFYPFWHSTQISAPGLNLSEYQNKEVDKLLKSSRETLDQETREQNYQDLQDTILSDAPALFLYNPDYLYWSSEKVQGIDTTKIVDPAKRFVNIINWYINTKRVWK